MESVIMLYNKQEIVPLRARKEKTLFRNQINLTKSSGYHQLHLMNGHLHWAEHCVGKASYWQNTNPAMLVRQACVTQQRNTLVMSDSGLLIYKNHLK